MFSILTLAVVITSAHSAPAPTPPSQQQSCEYSAMINNDRYKPVFKCYTEKEWQAKQASDRAAEARQEANDYKFWSTHWWIVLFIVIAVIALFFFATGY